jgi:hypothetical protein
MLDKLSVSIVGGGDKGHDVLRICLNLPLVRAYQKRYYTQITQR